MEKPPVTRESDKFMLRFPDGMRDRLKEAAHANGRSMNAEIVARLAASFEAHPDASRGLEQAEKRIEMEVQLGMVLSKLLKELADETQLVPQQATDLANEILARPGVQFTMHAFLQAADLLRRAAKVVADLPRTGSETPTRGLGLPETSLPRLYVLLDSHGYPQSWAEIHELISAISQAGKLNAVEIEAHVITPDMESSSRRKKEAAELARRLRSEAKSRPIDNNSVAVNAVKAALAADNRAAATVDAAKATVGTKVSARTRVRRG